jgi:integrase
MTTVGVKSEKEFATVRKARNKHATKVVRSERVEWPVATAQISAKERAVAKEQRVRQWITNNRNQRTQRTYTSGWNGFARYLNHESISVSEIAGADIADYLRVRVTEHGVAASTVHGDRAAISSHLRGTGQQALMNTTIVEDVMKVLRVIATPSKPKQALSADLMLAIVETHDRQWQRNEASKKWRAQTREYVWVACPRIQWIDERNVLLMLLMMMAMLRKSEAVGLRTKDVRVKNEQVNGVNVRTLQIYITSSKTDQEGVGAVVLLGTNDAEPSLCPIARCLRYVESTREQHIQSEFFFPTEKGLGMAASTPCGIVKRAVIAANEVAAADGFTKRWGDPESYGSHSLRRGGVTAARKNGVSMLDIQRHGRWKSLTVFAYVGRSEEEQKAVTESFLTGGRGTQANQLKQRPGVADDRVPPSAQIEQLQQSERSTAGEHNERAKTKRPRDTAPPTASAQQKRRRRKKETGEEIDRREEEEAAAREAIDEYQFDEYMQEGYEAGVELTQQ